MASTRLELARRFRWITSHRTFEVLPLLQRLVISRQAISSTRQQLMRALGQIYRALETHPIYLPDTTQRVRRVLVVDLV